MPKIIPLRELKEPSKISIMCHETDDPIFVTKNGASDMVILSSDCYDQLQKSSSAPNHAAYRLDETPEGFVAEPASLSSYMSARDRKPLYSIAELKAVLSPIFARHKVRKATLFGSYVKGTATSRSDVDLMVESDLKGLAFYGLLGEVADALRFPVDLIEKRQVRSGSDMEAEIAATGVIIYEC